MLWKQVHEHMCFIFARFTFLFKNRISFMLTKGALFCTIIIVVINIFYRIKVIARFLCYYVQMMTC